MQLCDQILRERNYIFIILSCRKYLATIQGEEHEERTIPETANPPTTLCNIGMYTVFRYFTQSLKLFRVPKHVVQHFQSTNMDHIPNMKQPHFQAFHEL